MRTAPDSRFSLNLKINPHFLLLLISSACLAAPAPEPTITPAAPYILAAEENPYAPRPEDADRQVTGLILTSMQLSERTDLTPARVQLNLMGSMPSVCNELRIEFHPPNATYQIQLEVYSLVNPDVNCDNVFQQFEASLLFGVYSPGRYTVWVNQGLIGDFIVY